MASIKNLKSKDKAVLFDPLGREYSSAYALRKRQFADLPQAKALRPLRAVRKVYATALGLWERSVIKSQREGGDSLAYPYGEEVTYRNAVRFAEAGQGQLVHRCAS